MNNIHKKSSPLAWRLSKENYKLARPTENIGGVIESFTIVHSAPQGYENKAPYILAVIILSSGEKTVSEIVECKNASIGDKVEPCLRRIYTDGDGGIIHYGTKFRVVK